jgi:aminoglycoside phosphotransferase (APT) family kinase protein
MLSQGIELEDLKLKILPWLQEKMPHAGTLEISDMERAGAGFTSISIPFTLTWREAGQPWTAGMVFRATGLGDPVYPDPKIEKQFRIMKSLQPTEVPVPRVYWMEKGSEPLGFPFYIMGKVEGVIPSEYPPYHSFGACYDASPECRTRMWWGAIEGMSKVHRLDWKQLGLSFLGVPPGGTGPLDHELDYYQAYLDWAKEERQPVLEPALEWLRKNRYAPRRVTLCWGDARLPNTVFSREGDLLALLDWDMAILSDPESDLAFMLVMDWLLSEGTGVPRLAGFPDRQETIARFEELTGWKVENFFYNEVFAVFRAGVVILRVQKNLQRMGIELPGEDPILDNFCTRRLADLLGFPSPATSAPQLVQRDDVSGTVQLHVTGAGGGDWYFVADRGRTTRHRGVAEIPDTTVTVLADDWSAIQSGELNPFNAWTAGKLKVSGNHQLYQQVADLIAKEWSAE